MSRKRVILYAIFALYQVGAYIFTVMVDGHLDLLAMLKYIPSFKYISLVGLVLVAMDISWFLAEKRQNKEKGQEQARENSELKRENSELKSRLYDQEHRKPAKQA